MELNLSDADARAIGIDSATKEKIVDLVHTYLGRASVVSVQLVDDPPGIKLKTASGIVTVDRALTHRIDH